MLIWVAGILALVLIAIYIFVDREIYFYEGVHLGPRIQGWLYNRWAKQYDRDKQASQAHDAETLARPLLEALAGVPEPFVLDVATGTGRFPLALLSEAGFRGRVIAVDISQGMLERAAEKLSAHRERVTLLRYTRLPLPFPDETFDVVGCLEALEVMPEMRTPLAEFARLLRPGGILVTSRGAEASGRKAKVVSAKQFAGLLGEAGFEQVEILPWWKNFDRVRARKPGPLTPSGIHTLEEALLCPACGKTGLTAASARPMRCRECGAELPVSPEGIILY